MRFAQSVDAMLSRSETVTRRFKTNQQGFTLLEIMIVTVIIGIAAALAVPNFTMMYARHELYQATTSLYNRLVFARSAAISRNAMIVATPANVVGAESQVTFTAPLGLERLPLRVTFFTRASTADRIHTERPQHNSSGNSNYSTAKRS